ncbi:MAG: zinc-binding dehydrogenase, partial [Candidatus Sericytochromatia bacterium]
LGEIDAIKGPDRYLPHLLGHEGTGRVLAIGPGVRQLAVGDHVILHWRPGRGIEAAPACYRWRGQPLNAGWVTTFSEHAIVSENRCTPIPAHLPMDRMALLGCAVTTALGALGHEAHLLPGEGLLILGAGGVGQVMVQGGRLMGATPVVAVDLHQAKLELALKLGADYGLSGDEPQLEDRLRQLAPGGFEVIVENTGRSQLIELAYRLAAPQGRILLVGVPAPADPVRLDTLPLHFGKLLIGSHGGATVPERDIPRYLRLIEAGRLDLVQLVSEVLPIAELNRALDDLRAGRVASRSLLKLSDGL